MFVLEVDKILQATPPTLTGEVGVCGNKANEKREGITSKKQRWSGDSSEATAAAAELTAEPPLPSHHSR